MGLETGSGQIYPSECQNCDLSTPGSLATDVARQKKEETEKGTQENSGQRTTFIPSIASLHINTLSPIPLLAKLWLFACSLAFHSKHIYSPPCYSRLSGIPCIHCDQMLHPE